MIVFASTVDLTGEAGQCTATRAVFLAIDRQAGDREVHLVAPRPERPEALPAVSRERIHLLPQKRRRSWIWSARGQAHMARHLVTLLRRGDAEAVVGRLSASIVTAPLLARTFDVPYLLLARGLGWNQPIPGVRWLNARLAAVVYAAFPEVLETLPGGKADVPGKMRLLPNAANTDRFRPLPDDGSRVEVRHAAGIEPGDFVIGFAGRMETHQSLGVLIQALAVLRRQGCEDARALLMGEGPERERLEARAEQLGLADAVVFTGWISQEEVARRVAACDVLYGVRSCGRPGSPLKIYEYLAAGRPVVVRASDEFRFVEEIGAGVTVEEARAGPVADALLALVEAGQEGRRGMGRRGREHVVQHHTWEAVGQTILEDVDRLGGERA